MTSIGQLTHPHHIPSSLSYLTTTMSHSHTHSHIDGHGHGHDHGHSHGHGDVSASNQEYFDQLAKKYDDLPGALEAARRIGAAIRKVYAFNEESTSVMDFACGTGTLCLSSGVNEVLMRYWNRRRVPRTCGVC